MVNGGRISSVPGPEVNFKRGRRGLLFMPQKTLGMAELLSPRLQGMAASLSSLIVGRSGVLHRAGVGKLGPLQIGLVWRPLGMARAVTTDHVRWCHRVSSSHGQEGEPLPSAGLVLASPLTGSSSTVSIGFCQRTFSTRRRVKSPDLALRGAKVGLSRGVDDVSSKPST